MQRILDAILVFFDEVKFLGRLECLEQIVCVPVLQKVFDAERVSFNVEVISFSYEFSGHDLQQQVFLVYSIVIVETTYEIGSVTLPISFSRQHIC